jgi:hypothetical protein
MWGNVINQISSSFERRFFVAYWYPATVGIGLLLSVIILIRGFGPTFGWIAALSAVTQILLALSVILIITALAYLLEGLTIPVIRLYEGYWQHDRIFKRNWKNKQQNMKDESKIAMEKQTGLQIADYLHFPKNDDQIKPTRLGNVLAAAEEYPLEAYRMESITWWPRLVAVLPPTILNSADLYLARMVAMLYFSMIFMLLAVGGGLTIGIVAWQTANFWWLLTLLFLLVGGFAFARLYYNAAVSQAEDYGCVVRTAFDLYRHELLQQMRLRSPANATEERYLWAALSARTLLYISPDEYPWKACERQEVDAWLSHNPFNYEYTAPMKVPQTSETIAEPARED